VLAVAEVEIEIDNFGSNTVTVVRASTGAVLATLTGNGLAGPTGLAFDGERVLVTNPNNDSVSLWKAADLSPLGNFPMFPGSSPIGACSDGIRFWVALYDDNKIVPF
jgi:DNA-binding beta-propeller fold protein YncE